MTTLYLILILALGGAALAVAAFAWSVRSGQLDDLDTPPRRMLTDELTRRAPDDAASKP
ncbi:MAG: cbb3-type cytochrome oxidase assembly protein CcoS [Myxococcales bacterium]|nr:cbb3-type cytochrome oxidase assembly protein CcoS [Myxococcales bacterium]